MIFYQSILVGRKIDYMSIVAAFINCRIYQYILNCKFKEIINKKGICDDLHLSVLSWILFWKFDYRTIFIYNKKQTFIVYCNQWRTVGPKQRKINKNCGSTAKYGLFLPLNSSPPSPFRFLLDYHHFALNVLKAHIL